MKQFDNNEFMMIDIVLVGTFNLRPIPAIFKNSGSFFKLRKYFSGFEKYDAVLKQKSRTAKTILFHFGLFLASIAIIISDTDFVTFGANNQVRNFWLSDFESIADKGWFTF